MVIKGNGGEGKSQIGAVLSLSLIHISNFVSNADSWLSSKLVSEKELVMAASSILSISSIVFLAFLRSHNTTAAAARKHSSIITMPVLFIFCHPAITDSIDGFNVFLCAKLIRCV